MIIVMKGRDVVVTFKHVTTTVNLLSIKDALTFTEVLKKVSEKRDESKLPLDFVEVLYKHLKSIGRICGKTPKQIQQAERLRLLAELTIKLKRDVHA